MDSLAEDLRTMQRRPLSEAHVAALRQRGAERAYGPGDFVIKAGEPTEAFFWVISGTYELWDDARGVSPNPNRLGPGQFIGEISFLTGGRMLYSVRACDGGTLLVVPREAVLRLMAAEPELSDILVSVFAARRRAMVEMGFGALTVVGHDTDLQVRAVTAFAARNKLPLNRVEPGSPDAGTWGAQCSFAHDPDEPKLILGAGELLPACTPLAIAERLGLAFTATETTFDVVIVGGGPAGVAAAVYAGAEGLSALVVEDLAIGGQAGQSSRIENYMGFPTGISGADLCFRGEVQAMKFGTRFAIPHRVTGLERDGAAWCLTLDTGARVLARAVVVATGVEYRRLPLERLAEFEGAGVYYAATETESRFCHGSEVVVVGGGNSAGQAAMFLSRTAACVHVLVRGAGLAASMSSYLIERLQQAANITVHTGAQVSALHGASALQAVTITTPSGTRRIEAPAVFVMVGAAPNTGWLGGCVALDRLGFVLTGADAGVTSRFATSVPGIFAVGDVRAGSVKRVASGVGEGSVVISDVWAHLNA